MSDSPPRPPESLASYLLRRADQQAIDLSRQLHDTTTQHLAALAIQLSLISPQTRDNPPLHHAISDAQTLVTEALDHLRHVACRLHPPLLNELGLEAGLKNFASTFAQHSAVRLSLRIEPNFPRLNSETEHGLFCIVQDRLRHLEQSPTPVQCELQLCSTPDGIALTIHDQSPATALNKSIQAEDLCLAAIRERASQIGGTIQIQPSDDAMRIHCRIERK